MSILSDIISKYITEGESILDVGCGIKTHSDPFLNTNKVTTVDAWNNVNPDILIDLEVEDFPFLEYQFDNIIMLDFIEHLSKNRGYEILSQCKRICSKRIFLFTPLIWSDNLINVNNPDLWCYGNEFDKHKSLWYEEDFIDFEKIVFPDYFFGVWRK